MDRMAVPTAGAVRPGSVAVSDQLLSICESSLVSKETLRDSLTLTVSRMGEREPMTLTG